MTVGGHRPERLAEEIHHEISLMLAGELADPRVAAVISVTEVRLTPDMRTVRAYVQLSGDDAERETALKGLKAAAGFVRHELTERLRLRRSPEVLFVPDTSEEYGNKIDQLLKKVKEE
jgi:ribosome-binding factor A